MPSYHYLGKHGFPHADNVNVYDYDNDLDYQRFDYSQMRVQVCSVPWDQGEAHIGQRTLEGIGNVVWFGTEQRRDAWFDAIPDSECFRWETKFKELHRDGELMVPIPFDVAARYNYVRVSYDLFASNDSPISYESGDGVREWFYFVREVEFVAPNATKLVLMDDVWQTWAYSINISSMVLERGHAPAFATKVDTYLADPIGNCSDLLAEDVNYGELQQVTKSQATPLNDEDMQAVIVTSADPRAAWGSKEESTWIVPAASHYDVAGVPNMNAFAVPVGSLAQLLTNCDTMAPQFKQSVQCVFFCESRLLSIGDAFTFCGTSCTEVLGGSAPVQRDIFTRTKEDWGYDPRYSGLAKLYTWPYSALEITDESGESEIVRIEDTAQALTMDVAANVVFPYVTITGSIHGIGGGKGTTVAFRNVTGSTFTASGRWYEHLRSWAVPTFAVVLSAGTEYDYSSHFDRAQMESDRATALGISTRDAGNAKTNADSQATTSSTNSQNVANASYDAEVTRANAACASTETTTTGQYTATMTTATAAQACEDNNARNILDNAAAQTLANTTINDASNAAATNDATQVNVLTNSFAFYDNELTRNTANNEIEAKNATSAISAASGFATSAAGAVSNALEGNIGGAIGGLISGGINAAATLASNQAAINLTSAQSESVIYVNTHKSTETQTNNTNRTNFANTAKTASTDATNTCITTSANNSSSAMTENAKTNYDATGSAAATTRDAALTAAGTVRDAAIKAAGITRDASVAAAQATEATQLSVNANNQSTALADARDTYDNIGRRIQNLVRQAGLRGPFVYGRVDAAQTATTRPMALWVNIVTESDYAIQMAGDEFLRYGYRYQKQWHFDGNWCVGKHFTYWKLRDYWSSTQIPDKYADQLRFFLYGGVTVWSDPADIGKVGIYDNGI